VFLFGRTGAGKKPPRPAQITEQKRQAYRASVEFPVVYAIEGRPGLRTAVANDLSAGGLRLVGDEDFPNETIVDFRFTLPNELIRGIELEKEVEEFKRGVRTKKRIMVPVEPFAEMRLRGKTVVTFLNVRRRKLMHGVQFLDVDERTREELQRFIHVWQIRQIRERALLRGG
jgi:c-di-GMP-binding flagellar brake protein YcgR